MNFLPIAYKKFLLFIFIIIFSISAYLALKLNLNLYIKTFAFSLSLFLGIFLLTIFELTNSLWENIVFWLVPTFLLAYFNIYLAAIFFILVIFKIFSQTKALSSLRVPFVFFARQNLSFVFLIIFLFGELFFYQTMIAKNQLFFSYQDFQKIIEKIQSFLEFFKINLPWNEKVNIIILERLKEFNLPKDVINNFLPQETLEEAFYKFLQTSWQNPYLRKIYLISFLSLTFLFFYPLAKIMSFIFSYFLLPFYYLLLKTNLVKIKLQTLEKEILEL